MKGQGLGREGGLNWDRVEPPVETGNFPAAGRKLASFEHDILRDPETPSVLVQANAGCWSFALNSPFVCFPLQVFKVLLRDYNCTCGEIKESCWLP